MENHIRNELNIVIKREPGVTNDTSSKRTSSFKLSYLHIDEPWRRSTFRHTKGLFQFMRQSSRFHFPQLDLHIKIKWWLTDKNAEDRISKVLTVVKPNNNQELTQREHISKLDSPIQTYPVWSYKITTAKRLPLFFPRLGEISARLRTIFFSKKKKHES